MNGRLDTGQQTFMWQRTKQIFCIDCWQDAEAKVLESYSQTLELYVTALPAAFWVHGQLRNHFRSPAPAWPLPGQRYGEMELTVRADETASVRIRSAMSFAEEKALLLAKLRIAEAELAAERSKSERFKRANNVSASPIAQRVMFGTEGDSGLGCASTPKHVLGGTHSLGVRKPPVSRDSALSESRGIGEERIVARVPSWALRFPATGEQDSEASHVESFTEVKMEVKEGVTREAAFGNDMQSEVNESLRMPVMKLVAREKGSAASHVGVHVADEPLATPCVTQRCVVDNGASCVNSGSVAAEHEGSQEREPVVAACGDVEHSGSMAERPRALQDAATRESREDAVGVTHIASCVSRDTQMSCRENVIAMGSSYELIEESVNQCTAAFVMQPEAVAGVTAGIAEEAVNVSVNVTAKQPSAAYADQRCVVEHGAPSAEAAEPEGSHRNRRERQSASPQCSVAATHARKPTVVPSRARKGGEGSVILWCDGVRRMAGVFSDDDGRCVPPSKAARSE
ncbi:hypothetical protein HPB48_015911 [Haemaphysalis longicornis]|uniref:Uncharacterized protein n=1 Tax=Haemaphysalis longicornis TaxID=44386 RepID=A0A9J6GT48_HAELO|nr:hypothetical protein HPB48_015911 [Haemaphysalis longicornis]